MATTHTALPSQEELTLMAANLMQLRSIITTQPPQHIQTSPQHIQTSPQHHHTYTSHVSHVSHISPTPSQPIPPTSSSLLSQIKQSHNHYLQSIQLPLNNIQKMIFLLQSPLSIGSAIQLFTMLYYFKQALQQQIIEQIIGKVWKGLIQSQSEMEKWVYGEVVAECGMEDQEICRQVVEWMVEEEYLPFQLCFMILNSQKMTGLVYLVDIASKDIANLSHKILDNLSKSQPILTTIIIPCLISDILDTSLSKHRDLPLSALNRISPLIPTKYLPLLVHLIHDNNVNKMLLIYTIRGMGMEGVRMLVQMVMSGQIGENVMGMVLQALAVRVNQEKYVGRIKCIQYTADQVCRLYQYQGNIQPWLYKEDQICQDVLWISQNDLLTHLQQHLTHLQHPLSSPHTTNYLASLLPTTHIQQQIKIQLDPIIITTITHQLKISTSIHIKELCLVLLGNIGYPQAENAVEIVYKCLGNKDAGIRSAACWTIARIRGKQSNNYNKMERKIEAKMGQLLRDNFWKVRTSACIAIGLVVTAPQAQTVQALIKVLKEGSVPKNVVCQTMARIGTQELLLQILKGCAKSDFKLRQAVLSSLQYVSPHSPFMHSIVQQLMRHSRDSRLQTRQLCLTCLSSLSSSSPTLPSLSPKALLPFFYIFLSDPSSKIRSIAATKLLDLGPQAQLLFIQGMTKGNALTKMECIKALGVLGVQNFRAIVLGLRDEEEMVRRVACETIMSKFRVEEVLEEYGAKESRSVSLICNLKELVSRGQYAELTVWLRRVLVGLQGYPKCFSPVVCDQNADPNRR